MLKANQAVRRGLRAASRNAELSFGKALLDQAGGLLALLPAVLAGLLIAAASQRDPFAALRALAILPRPVIGGIATAMVISFAGGMLFWAGALPLLAADVEMDRRPPEGNFALLASRGFARVLLAGAVAGGLTLLFSLVCGAGLLAAIPVAFRSSPAFLAAAALLATAAIVGSVLLDVLARLVLMRAAAFGESASAAFGKAASLLSARLGA